MPCYDSRNDPAYIREEAREAFTHNSPVADLLCFTMKHVASQTRAALIEANPKLAKWWSDHQERDRKVAKEQKELEAREQAAIRSQIAALQKKLK